MALNQWFKFYGGEYLSDPKIASLSAQERSCWVTLLSLTSISSTPGMVEYLTTEVLLEKAGVHYDPYNPDEWNDALSVLEKFSKMKMIIKNKDGSIEIVNWRKRQEMALTNAERQANYRRRNAGVTSVTTNVTVDKNRLDKNNTNIPQIAFEEFWVIYPKKTQKQKAKLKWDKLPEDTKKIILEDIPKRKGGRKWKEGFIEDPTTYLNGARWEDEIQVVYQDKF